MHEQAEDDEDERRWKVELLHKLRHLPLCVTVVAQRRHDNQVCVLMHQEPLPRAPDSTLGPWIIQSSLQFTRIFTRGQTVRFQLIPRMRRSGRAPSWVGRLEFDLERRSLPITVGRSGNLVSRASKTVRATTQETRSEWLAQMEWF